MGSLVQLLEAESAAPSHVSPGHGIILHRCVPPARLSSEARDWVFFLSLCSVPRIEWVLSNVRRVMEWISSPYLCPNAAASLDFPKKTILSPNWRGSARRGASLEKDRAGKPRLWVRINEYMNEWMRKFSNRAGQKWGKQFHKILSNHPEHSRGGWIRAIQDTIQGVSTWVRL